MFVCTGSLAGHVKTNARVCTHISAIRMRKRPAQINSTLVAFCTTSKTLVSDLRLQT